MTDELEKKIADRKQKEREELEKLVGKRVKRTLYWDRAQKDVREEFELLTLKHKDNIYQIRTGTSRRFDVHGNLVEERFLTTATYTDRDKTPYTQQGPYTMKIYQDGKLVATESWKPTYGRPFSGPTSLFMFTLDKRVKHA